jgi:hypothetical protein
MARILDMISTARKLVLIPAPRPVGNESGVRRYRLARLALNPVRERVDGSFDHLKRSYD